MRYQSKDDDEYVPGEFAGAPEPEINVERIRKGIPEVQDKLKRENPELWAKIQATEKARKATSKHK